MQQFTSGVSLGISKHLCDPAFISGMLCQKSKLSSYLKDYQLPSHSWRVYSNSYVSETLLKGCQVASLCKQLGVCVHSRAKNLPLILCKDAIL